MKTLFKHLVFAVPLLIAGLPALAQDVGTTPDAADRTSSGPTVLPPMPASVEYEVCRWVSPQNTCWGKWRPR